jgi:AcrR family transcriptional regulator
MEASTAGTRRYDSPLRNEQALETRERVLSAAVSELAHAPSELTVPAVARRARVALRTVYRHFPTKQALIEGVAQRFQERFGAPYFATLDDLPDATARMVRSFHDDEELVQAVLRLDPEALAPERAARIAALEQTLAPLLAGRSPAERRQIVGALYATHGLLMWQTLRAYVGLDDADAGAAAAWATRTLLDGLRSQAASPRPPHATATEKRGTA